MSIQAINSNVSFKGNEKPKNPLVNGVANVVKTYNNLSYPVRGAINGTAQGIGVTALVGLIGKNVHKKEVGEALGGIVKDCGKFIGNAIKSIPAVLTKAPLENVKNLAGLPGKFYGTYLKENKGVAALATVAGLATLAVNIIKARLDANKANADIDHKTGNCH